MPIIFINNIYLKQFHMLPIHIFFWKKMDNIDTLPKVPTVNKGFYA